MTKYFFLLIDQIYNMSDVWNYGKEYIHELENIWYSWSTIVCIRHIIVWIHINATYLEQNHSNIIRIHIRARLLGCWFSNPNQEECNSNTSNNINRNEFGIDAYVRCGLKENKYWMQTQINFTKNPNFDNTYANEDNQNNFETQ